MKSGLDRDGSVTLLGVWSLSAVVAATVPSPVRDHRTDVGTGSRRLLDDSLRLLRDSAGLRRVAAVTVVTNPGQYALLFLYQPYFDDAGTPLWLFGSAVAVASALGATIAGSAGSLERTLGRRDAFRAVVALVAAEYLTMAMFNGPFLAPVLFVGAFAAMQLHTPFAAAMRNPLIPSDNRATALSVVSMAVGVWSLALKLLVGWVADRGLTEAFVLLGILPLLGLIALPLPPHHRTRRDGP